MRNYSQAEVGTTPQRVVEQNASRTSLAIANMSGTAIVYVGADNQITTETGFPIAPGSLLTFNTGFGDRPDMARWLIGEEAGIDVRVIEEYGVE